MIVGVSGFGFPKAHGAAFGLLAYQSTWLRVHHGPEFLCALLDEQPMGFYPPDALVHEGQRRGIEILPPDVNASEVICTVTPEGGVRLGLGYVAGVQADEVDALVAARRSDGPFRSLDDLASRAGAGRPALERLAWSGACDALALAGGGGAVTGRPASARRTALWRLGIAAPAYGAGDDGTQLSLPVDLPQAPALAGLGDWDAMIADYATTGLTIHRHPLRLLREGLAARGAVTSADLAGLPHGSDVRVGGLVVARQRPGTANGIVFLLIEDEMGTVNVIVPPPVYERHRLTVRSEPLMMVEGKLERHASAGGAINLLVRRLSPIDAADVLAERPRPSVKDFSPLDEIERRRILAEQPLVAVAGGGAVAASPRTGTPAIAASAGPGLRPGEPVHTGRARPGEDSRACPGEGIARAGRPGPTGRPDGPARGERDATDDAAGRDAAREHGGAEDFRAVAPPVMSFAQGRRR
jgi:error-prone DNA polymerase